MNYEFDSELALKIGINEAIFIQKISKEYGDIFSLSLREMCKIFPFIPVISLRRLIKRLLKEQIITIKNVLSKKEGGNIMYEISKSYLCRFDHTPVIKSTHPCDQIDTPPQEKEQDKLKDNQNETEFNSAQILYLTVMKLYRIEECKNIYKPKKEKEQKEKKVIFGEISQETLFEQVPLNNKRSGIALSIHESAVSILDSLNKKVYPAIRRSPFKQSDNNLCNIRARLKEGATEEDCLHVIAVKCEEWLYSDMSKYLIPATLFRKSNFEKYVTQKFHGEIKIARKQTPTQAALERELSAIAEKFEEQGYEFGKYFNLDD